VGVVDLLATIFRQRDKPKANVRVTLPGGLSASSDYIEFFVDLGNDGTLIARGVVARALLDDEPIAASRRVDVPQQTPAVRVHLALRRPEQADLDGSGRVVLHGRHFTVAAELDGRVVAHAEWFGPADG
jgi:hypothetical protein